MLSWSVRPCVRPVDAARTAAGHGRPVQIVEGLRGAGGAVLKDDVGITIVIDVADPHDLPRARLTNGGSGGHGEAVLVPDGNLAGTAVLKEQVGFPVTAEIGCILHLPK